MADRGPSQPRDIRYCEPIMGLPYCPGTRTGPMRPRPLNQWEIRCVVVQLSTDVVGAPRHFASQVAFHRDQDPDFPRTRAVSLPSSSRRGPPVSSATPLGAWGGSISPFLLPAGVPPPTFLPTVICSAFRVPPRYLSACRDGVGEGSRVAVPRSDGKGAFEGAWGRRGPAPHLSPDRPGPPPKACRGVYATWGLVVLASSYVMGGWLPQWL